MRKEKNKRCYSRLFVILLLLSVIIIMISNVCSIKLFSLGKVILPTSALLFPISYILGDVLAEVYGFKKARNVILIGFAANLFMILFFQLSIVLPAASTWNLQHEYATILGTTPKMLFASLMAYLAGSLSNAYSLNVIKKVTKGKYLWIRTIGSTIAGELLDTLIFVVIAFYGVIPTANIFITIVSQFIWKVSYETLATPLTYYVINKVKNYEKN